MDRISIIQSLIDANKFSSYLEIGVNRGYCFFNLRCKNKTGLDPRFEIPLWRKWLYAIKNATNLKNNYIEKTSDDFFKTNKKSFDIILIDGLHTFHQSYQDIINSLKVLNPNGFILLHDCSPISAASAQDVESITEAKKHPDYAGDWSGAVWKSIVKFRQTHPAFFTAVIDTDHGVGILAPHIQSNKHLTHNLDLQQLDYSDLEKNRKELLNLMSVQEYQTWLADLG